MEIKMAYKGENIEMKTQHVKHCLTWRNPLRKKLHQKRDK